MTMREKNRRYFEELADKVDEDRLSLAEGLMIAMAGGLIGWVGNTIWNAIVLGL